SRAAGQGRGEGVSGTKQGFTRVVRRWTRIPTPSSWSRHGAPFGAPVCVTQRRAAARRLPGRPSTSVLAVARLRAADKSWMVGTRPAMTMFVGRCELVVAPTRSHSRGLDPGILGRGRDPRGKPGPARE